MNPISSAVMAKGVSTSTLMAVIYELWPLSLPAIKQSDPSNDQISAKSS